MPKSLTPRLAQLKEEIEGHARSFGLDFFETVFELLGYDELNMVASYGGFPNRYPHWRWGMEYEQLSKGYEYGLSKIYELVDNITVTDYCYDFYVVGTNKQWWENLPKDVALGMEAALDAANKWNWENGKKINEESNTQIKAAGVDIHTLTPEQKALWVKAVQPVWKSLGDDLVGAQVMARLKEISAKYK